MNEWISVKDRLPKEGQSVLCCNSQISYKKVYERGIFYDGDTHCYYPIGKVENVTYWMPLPEPPKD